MRAGADGCKRLQLQLLLCPGAAERWRLAMGKALLSPPCFGVWQGWGARGGVGGMDVRLSAPRGLCWEELKVRKQVAEGTEEEVWCGQPPWENAALSDGGGEGGFFAFVFSTKGCAGMGAAVTPELSPELLQPAMNPASLSIS